MTDKYLCTGCSIPPYCVLTPEGDGPSKPPRHCPFTGEAVEWKKKLTELPQEEADRLWRNLVHGTKTIPQGDYRAYERAYMARLKELNGGVV